MSLSVHRVDTGQCIGKSRLVRARSSALIAAVCQVGRAPKPHSLSLSSALNDPLYGFGGTRGKLDA
jgi:hypothetical protein